MNIQCHPGHILFDPKTTEKELWETVNFFEEYLDFLFSFDEGESNRLLYYPCNCTIVNDFWPNCSEEEFGTMELIVLLKISRLKKYILYFFNI